MSDREDTLEEAAEHLDTELSLLSTDRRIRIFTIADRKHAPKTGTAYQKSMTQESPSKWLLGSELVAGFVGGFILFTLVWLIAAPLVDAIGIPISYPWSPLGFLTMGLGGIAGAYWRLHWTRELHSQSRNSADTDS